MNSFFFTKLKILLAPHTRYHFIVFTLFNQPSVEMRHSVATPLYLFKRALDRLFAALTSSEGTPRLSALPTTSVTADTPNGASSPGPGSDAKAEEDAGSNPAPLLSTPRPLPNDANANENANAYSSASATAHLHALAQVPFPTRIVSGWVPLYTMVTFRPDVGYATAREQAARQQKVLTALGWTGAVGTVGAFVWGVSRAVKMVQQYGGKGTGV